MGANFINAISYALNIAKYPFLIASIVLVPAPAESVLKKNALSPIIIAAGNKRIITVEASPAVLCPCLAFS